MRWQLSLILAYSITTHKSQSMTAHNGIVYEPAKNKQFARGLPYVAISRATDLEKLHYYRGLLNFLEKISSCPGLRTSAGGYLAS